jgi:uncharacterized protein
VIRTGERVFVDTGAWIALAIVRDPLHERARATYDTVSHVGGRLFTSTAVILETFTYLDRKGSREIALRWFVGLSNTPRLQTLDCTPADISLAVPRLSNREFHRLSLVDATSFVLMQRHRLRVAFAYDTHFAIAGFRLL